MWIGWNLKFSKPEYYESAAVHLYLKYRLRCLRIFTNNFWTATTSNYSFGTLIWSPESMPHILTNFGLQLISALIWFSVILILDIPALLLARSVSRGILIRCAPHRLSVEQFIESLCWEKLPMIWRTIKKWSGSLTFTRIPQLEQNAVRANNNQHKANVLGNHFQAVSSSSDYPQIFTPCMETFAKPPLRLGRTTHEPMLFSQWMNWKQPSLKPKILHQAMNNFVMKCLASVQRLSWNRFLFFFNNICSTGVVPQSWLHSIVIPIYKPGKPSNLPSSYRPISLTSNACKILKKWWSVV